MCFIMQHGHEQELVATEDIPCFKILEDAEDYIEGKISPFMGFLYKFGETYQEEMYIDNRTIHQGFHSYINHDFAADNCWSLREDIYAAVIPAGSKYYQNLRDGEYVSNALKVIEKA